MPSKCNQTSCEELNRLILYLKLWPFLFQQNQGFIQTINADEIDERFCFSYLEYVE